MNTMTPPMATPSTRRAFLRNLGGAAVACGIGRGAAIPALAAENASRRPREVALAAFARHQALHSFDHYTGILSLQALARLAMAEKDEALIARSREALLPFVRGERTFQCNFPNYLIGGNGAAYLLWQGRLPEAEAVVRRHARMILEEAARSRDGIVTRPDKRGTEAIFIDAAFAICPFLAFAGRALGEPALIDEALGQIRKLFAILRDPENGLLHQARGFSNRDQVTEDHWSRGNGWGLLAITEVCDALPEKDPRRAEATILARDLVEACVRAQDASGLWHQELPRHDSYVETSGTGLILYALGTGLLRGWVAPRHRPAFARGLAAYGRYIDSDGSVDHTCQGCLSPGAGTIADYMARPAAKNDRHAFGPVTLAFGVAAQLDRRIGG